MQCVQNLHFGAPDFGNGLEMSTPLSAPAPAPQDRRGPCSSPKRSRGSGKGSGGERVQLQRCGAVVHVRAATLFGTRRTHGSHLGDTGHRQLQRLPEPRLPLAVQRRRARRSTAGGRDLPVDKAPVSNEKTPVFNNKTPVFNDH